LRRFVALLLPEFLRLNLETLCRDLDRAGASVKWVETGNFHLTIKFLGETSDKQRSGIMAGLERAVDDSGPITLDWGGVGAFPSPKRPRVIWVGLATPSPQLERLANRVEQEMAELGFPRESRPFQAHITLGRLRDSQNPGNLPRQLALHARDHPGKISVLSLHLMKSILTGKGPIYTSEASFELSGRGG